MRGPIGRFVMHYVEMVVAMLLGMGVLGVPLGALVSAIELDLLVMAVTMTVPMVAWMRYRGHGWAPVWEMTGAMFLPTFVAIALLWAGSVEDRHALLMIQHVAMFPAMFAVMLLRPSEYTGHSGHARAAG